MEARTVTSPTTPPGSHWLHSAGVERALKVLQVALMPTSFRYFTTAAYPILTTATGPPCPDDETDWAAAIFEHPIAFRVTLVVPRIVEHLVRQIRIVVDVGL